MRSPARCRKCTKGPGAKALPRPSARLPIKQRHGSAWAGRFAALPPCVLRWCARVHFRQIRVGQQLGADVVVLTELSPGERAAVDPIVALATLRRGGTAVFHP